IAHPLGIEFGARNANAKAYVEHRLYDRFLPVLCRHLPMGWLVDVGANVGATAVGIARECANPILCVEMDDEFCALLRRNTARVNVRVGQELGGSRHYLWVRANL